jgi:hypothetical protein
MASDVALSTISAKLTWHTAYVAAHFNCSPIRNDIIFRPIKFDIIFSPIKILTNLFFSLLWNMWPTKFDPILFQIESRFKAQQDGKFVPIN